MMKRRGIPQNEEAGNLPPTHVHNHEHDPNTDLDLQQDLQQNHHLWVNNKPLDAYAVMPSEAARITKQQMSSKSSRQQHHRSLSSSSHKYYRQESTTSSCSNDSASCSSTASSNCDSSSFRLNSSNKSKETSFQDPSKSSSGSSAASSSGSSRFSTFCTILGVIILFFLSCVLLLQFSSDLRSAIKINHLFQSFSPHDSNHLTSGANSVSEPAPTEETFNNQVTSRIISLILPEGSVIRETKSGSLMGFTVRELGHPVSVFLGIPYAKPPIGRLRFAKPKPITAWKGLRDASRFGHQCIQFKPNSTRTPWISSEDNMSEDCLTLNIWSPEGASSSGEDRHPVMVWFHGGAFFSGSTDLPIYDGRTLAALGQVVVVTVNYRLGVYGFLDARSTRAPGNQGLHDQVTALQWVKENIRNFGGDENQVTIFGQSAGAISVGLHYLSPLSRNLFRRGILQSGSPTVSRLFYERDPGVVDVKNKLPQLAVLTGCLSSTDLYLKTPLDKIISCLKLVDADLLTSAQNHLIQELSLSFGPSAGDDFLPDLPINILHNVDTDDHVNDKHSIRRRQVNESVIDDASSQPDYTDDYTSDSDDESDAASDMSEPRSSAEESAPLTSEKHDRFRLSNRKEVMMGVNANEGSYFLHYLDPDSFGYDPKNITYNESLSFIGKQFNFLPSHFTKVLIDLFLSEERETNDSHIIRESLSHFISDSTFTCPASLFAQLVSGIGIRTFFYLFDHQASIRRFMPDWMGVMHFDEVPFVFGHPIREANLYTQEEVKFSRDIMTAWINFARGGSPNQMRSSTTAAATKPTPAEREGDEESAGRLLSDLKWDNYSKDAPSIMLLKSGNESRILRDGIRDSTCSKWRIILENS